MLATPCVLVAVILRPEPRRVCGALAAYVLVWFVSIQEYRGLAPILSLVAFVTASTLADMVGKLSRPFGKGANTALSRAWARVR